jgi:hypothetical protein
MAIVFAAVAVVLWAMAIVFAVLLAVLADVKQSLWNRLRLYESERDRKFRLIDAAIHRHEESIRSMKYRPGGTQGHTVITSQGWSRSSSAHDGETGC